MASGSREVAIFSKYHSIDDRVINKASEYGLYLIGGTALEVWSNYYKFPGVRKRSNNDLDFLASEGNKNLPLFQAWLIKNVDPKKVKVDVLLTKKRIPKHLYQEVHGTRIMSINYIIWSKAIRFNDKDRADIKWLLKLVNSLGEDHIVQLEQDLEELQMTNRELSRISNIIDSI